MNIDSICGCGHPRDGHRYIPQRGACPAGGCECAGYHLPGTEMPVPQLPVPPSYEPPSWVEEKPRRVVSLGGRVPLALLIALVCEACAEEGRDELPRQE
jgi:hypothetical protein